MQADSQVTAKLQQFLHGEMPLLGACWQRIEALPIAEDHRVFIVLFVVPLVWFYFYGFLLFLVDMLGSPEFRARYKVQKSIVINSGEYWNAFKVSLFNWFFLTLPYIYSISYYVVPRLVPSMPPLPTVWVFVRDMAVYILVEEVMFYFSHRALHHPSLYGPIHKFHHKYTAPFGIAAIYAHPIEHLLSNVVPVSVGSLVMRSHPVLPMFWGVLALFNTMTVHSGYDFSHWGVFPAPYFHDWHHERFNENFGAIQVLDWLLGTNQQYLKAIRAGDVYIPRRDDASKSR